MSNKSKQKGDRAEAQVRDALDSIPGVTAKRVGLSAQASREVRGDIKVAIEGVTNPLMVEVKSRAGNTGWKQLEKWIEGVDILALKIEGSCRPLMVLTWDTFEDLIRLLAKPEPEPKPYTEPYEL